MKNLDVVTLGLLSMDLAILCPYWGHEHLKITDFLKLIAEKGYDGIDTWIPLDPNEKQNLRRWLDDQGLKIVAHQHRAEGATFQKFCRSFEAELLECAEVIPLLINSHTGHDYFKKEQFLTLIKIAEEFSAKTGITVAHETHRGRFGYSPQMIAEFLELCPEICLTADFSHWTCVTESMLSHFKNIVELASKKARAIHARVGFEEGPQITDPRDPVWRYAVDRFLKFWDTIIYNNIELGTALLPITTEFGPFPYMTRLPFSQEMISNQFEINCYMKDLLKARYLA